MTNGNRDSALPTAPSQSTGRGSCIAYISSALPARSETFVYREIRELRRRGWDVVCVSLYPPAERIAGLEDIERDRIIVYGAQSGWFGSYVKERVVHPLRSCATDWAWQVCGALAPGEPTGIVTRAKLLGQSMHAQALAHRLRARGVRHIHCHFAHAPTTVGMYTAIQLGVPFSFTGHANDLFQRRALLRRKLQRAAFINCISEWHKSFYIELEPACADKCHVVRCGVDVEGWNIDPTAKGTAWNREFRIATVCRLVEKKGVDTLLRGLGRYARDGGRFELIIAGDGPQRAQLEQIAKDEHIAQRVKFTGAMENEQVKSLLASCDAFALACRDDSSGDRDGIPVVLMEAMACGLPVISGDLPAIRELVVHDSTGLLVDGADPAAVAAAISRLAADESLRRRLGQAGRNRVVEEFSLSENVSRMEHLLRGSISTTTCGVPITSSNDMTRKAGQPACKRA